MSNRRRTSCAASSRETVSLYGGAVSLPRSFSSSRASPPSLFLRPLTVLPARVRDSLQRSCKTRPPSFAFAHKCQAPLQARDSMEEPFPAIDGKRRRAPDRSGFGTVPAQQARLAPENGAHPVLARNAPLFLVGEREGPLQPQKLIVIPIGAARDRDHLVNGAGFDLGRGT